MTAQCENCHGMFFKTLESRFIPGEACLLTKKRCKRCKFKFMFRKDGVTGAVSRIDLEQWQQASKVPTCVRGQIHISEYSRRIANRPEFTRGYLEQIRRAEGRGHG